MTSKYPGVKRLPSGRIEYRGTTFAGFNKPRKSTRPEKKGMVLAKEGDTVRVIHFGQKGYGHNYSSTARKSFKSRHAQNIKKVNYLLLTGLIKFCGLVRVGARKAHRKLKSIRN